MRKRREDVAGARIETKLLLSVDEAAMALSVGRSLVYELVMREEIVSVKVGRLRRIPVSALQSYVERQLALAR